MKKTILLILTIICVYTSNLHALENVGIISGRITSKMNNKQLPGVTVKILNTSLGAISKSDGYYIIKNVPAGVYRLQFSFVGYEIQVLPDVQISPGRATTLDIEMAEKVIELEEAEVRASYFDKKIETATSTQMLNFEDIRRAPGVNEDVIRATALLPGVNVTAAGRNDLIVRGGAPFENLFLVDNIEVNNINHFGSQGSTGGPLSIINLDFVRNVEFSAGGFGAKYGDKTSSMTNITLRNGNEEKFGGKAYISATGFGANIEGPLSDKGLYLFSVRRSYLDFIFKAAGLAFVPEYWDYQGKINYRLDNNNTLSLISISAINTVELNNDDQDNVYKNSRVAIPNQYQNFSGLTYKNIFSSGFFTATLGSSYTKFTTYQNDSNLVEIFKNNSKEGELIFRTDLDYQFSDKFFMTIGNQIKYGAILDYDILISGDRRTDNNGVPRPLKVDTTLNTIKNSTYASLNYSFGHHRFSVGGRLDYYNFTKENLFISPRLSYILTLNENSSIIFSAGRYYQAPSYIWNVGGSTEKLNPILADQAVIGYSHTPLEDVKVQIEGYYKFYQNYPERVYRPQAVLAPSGFDDISSDVPFGLEPLISGGTGYSRGVELFIQKKMSDIPLYGLMSLTYSESYFKGLDNIEHPSAYDSRIIFNISAGYRFAGDWELSSKFRLATGVPTTPYLTNGQKDYTQYNLGERLELFHSMDVRLEKRWFLSSLSIISYIDISNVYNRKNISGIRWNYRLSQVEYNESFGILPTIGLSLEF